MFPPQVALAKRDVNSVREPDQGLETEVLEAWADPSLNTTAGEDQRAGLQKRYVSRTAYRVECLLCNKSFTTLASKSRCPF